MKAAIVATQAEMLKALIAGVAAAGKALEISSFELAPEQVAMPVQQIRPDLLLLACEEPDLAALRGIEAVMPAHPAMNVILVAPRPTQEFLIQAMRIGVREVLPAPLAPDAVQQAVLRVRQRHSKGAAPRARGQVVALVACKGGSGASFLATNLAYALAAEGARKVLLIDFNLHFGEALLYISDATPTSTIADVARHIQRLDGDFLATSTVQVLPNFGVLAAPESPERIVDISPESVERLFGVAVAHYDFVIVDVSRNLDALSVRALDHADLICPVLQVTLPFIRDAKRLVGVLHTLGYANGKIRLIVNRNERGAAISLQDVERAIGLPVFKAIPNSYAAVAESINRGTPLLRLAPRDPVARAMLDLMQSLAAAPARGQGWLAGLLGRREALRTQTV